MRISEIKNCMQMKDKILPNGFHRSQTRKHDSTLFILNVCNGRASSASVDDPLEAVGDTCCITNVNRVNLPWPSGEEISLLECLDNFEGRCETQIVCKRSGKIAKHCSIFIFFPCSIIITFTNFPNSQN